MGLLNVMSRFLMKKRTQIHVLDFIRTRNLKGLFTVQGSKDGYLWMETPFKDLKLKMFLSHHLVLRLKDEFRYEGISIS